MEWWCIVGDVCLIKIERGCGEGGLRLNDYRSHYLVGEAYDLPVSSTTKTLFRYSENSFVNQFSLPRSSSNKKSMNILLILLSDSE